MEMYSTTLEEMTQNSNATFIAILDGLVKEKFLSKEQEEEILKSYNVVCYKPSMFNSFFRNLIHGDKEDRNKIYIKLVKVL